MAFLIANGIAKSFGDTLELENASLTVNAGDRVGLVGSNGVGKSALQSNRAAGGKSRSASCNPNLHHDDAHAMMVLVFSRTSMEFYAVHSLPHACLQVNPFS